MDDRSTTPFVCKVSFQLVIRFSAWLAILSVPVVGSAQESNWIWSPKEPTEAVDGTGSQGECYFRKQFTLMRPEQAELIFAAGDEFEIFINGQLCTRGQSYGSISRIDVGEMLEPGVNLVAARVRHNSSEYVGLAIKLRVKEYGETRWRSLVSDDSWKTRREAVTSWNKSSYNDIGWLKANTLGEVQFQKSSAVATETRPKATMPVSQALADTATESQPETDRQFEIDSEFTIQQVFAPHETGSLIAMEFNEFGQLLLSREGGPLLLADPSKPQGHPGRVRIFCSEVNSCQGILALNGKVFVTAQGPQGLGLYVLADQNRDGKLEVENKLAGFTGKLGEHGPHGLQLGLDGMLYVIVGNGSSIEGEVSSNSPYQHPYEADLVSRMEDPGGHAQGIKAPGGTVVRISLDGSLVETVAGGIRNAYDLVFDDRGELFAHDSDMESDMGMTWYRPTYVYHVAHGADFGWRSGWSKFPQHFIDLTPAVCDTGRGSPTGAVLYQHMQFPVRYQNTVFLGDWSEGRILALRKQPDGATYQAKPEVFLTGRPLNVCDLAVGEDGGLYFCTGGRGTSGGVFRVVWNGRVPEKMLEFESDLARVIRHPQPGSAWARQSIAELKKSLGDQWGPSLVGVATEQRNPAKFRIRATQLMVLYGPTPDAELLESLANDSDASIRGQAAWLGGLIGDDASQSLLMNLIQDSSPQVRRMVCESCLRLGIQPPVENLVPMLKSADRVEAMVARRILERIPVQQWANQLLGSEDIRLFMQASVAAMTADPSLEHAYKILARSSQFMDGFVNDTDFVDLLRTMQLALVRGKVDPNRVPAFATRIGNEFPSGSPVINQELSRLLAYLKVGYLDGRIAEYLQSPDVEWKDKVHTAMHLQTIGTGLSGDLRLTMIDCLESARHADGVGGSYQQYLKNAVEQVAQSITSDQILTILQNGDRWPNAVIAAFYKLPDRLDQDTVARIIELDQSIMGLEDPASQQLRLGVIAVLARSGGESSMAYLRQLWQEEVSRRNDIVIGLSQQPDGENWAYLVSSLPNLDDLTAREVLSKLSVVSRRPREPQYFREVILLGFRLRNNGATEAVKLLEHWSGEQQALNSTSWENQLKAWQSWFQSKWPDQPAPVLEEKDDSHSLSQVLGYLETNGVGDAVNGKHVFQSAKCATCHQLDGTGQNIGPDLTKLAMRFSAREVLEATIHPSKIISDQYASRVVLTTDGRQFHGMTVEQPDESVMILLSDGNRVRVQADQIEAIRESQVSAMPDGLLDRFSLSEIADLMAFMMNSETAKVDSNAPTLVR